MLIYHPGLVQQAEKWPTCKVDCLTPLQETNKKIGWSRQTLIGSWGQGTLKGPSENGANSGPSRGLSSTHWIIKANRLVYR
jgi:hypothetical protein